MTGEAWRQYLQTYVALRRAIGFTMQREVRLLQDFVEHLERRGHDAPVAQVAVEWASASTESQHAGRLSIVRGFLTMVRAAEPDVDVPGVGLVRTCKRPTPRILAPDEIVALMDAARSLGPPNALRPHTVATVIGLRQRHGDAGFGFDEKLLLRQEAGEQHPVPVLVGHFVGEAVDRLSAGYRIAPVPELAPVRPQTSPQVLLRRGHRRVGAGVTDREHAERVACAGFARPPRRLHRLRELIAKSAR